MKFLKDGLSLDETKVSVIMISFVIMLGISIRQIFESGDISDNVLTLDGYLLVAVTGINALDLAMKKKDKKDEIGE